MIEFLPTICLVCRHTKIQTQTVHLCLGELCNAQIGTILVMVYFLYLTGRHEDPPPLPKEIQKIKGSALILLNTLSIFICYIHRIQQSNFHFRFIKK